MKDEGSVGWRLLCDLVLPYNLFALLILLTLPRPAAAQGPPAPEVRGPTDHGYAVPAEQPSGPSSSSPHPSSFGMRGPADHGYVVPAGQPSWRQDFEGPTTSWTEAGGDAQYSLIAHQRVRGGAHGGQGSEWIQVSGQGGSAVLMAHDIGRPSVIEELRPSIWIYADRPGIQFYAEVALPRTLHPRTGRPLTTPVFGTAYTTAGRWQRLEIADIPRKVAGQARILRSELAMNVDDHEAYVSRVLLNVYGGPGVTNVWTDDLEVSGHVPSFAGAPADHDQSGPALISGSAQSGRRYMVPDTVPGAGFAIAADHGYMVPAAAGLSGSNAADHDHGYMVPAMPPPREIKLAGSVLKINEYPIFPRGIEYRGERLAFLKQLGFNTVWLRQAPSPALLAEARQLGLWLVCPPPDAAAIGPEFEPVLVWDMGRGLTGESLDATRQRADRVRLADARVSRPLICAPVNNLRGYSRGIVNLLLIDRRPLGTSLEMPDYGNWVRRQPLLALPGTPVWTTVQTQTGEGLRRQLAAMAPGQAPPTVVGPEQIKLLVYTAISSGSRGLLFLSDSSLEAQDGETRQRAMTLDLLNLELEVVEPWVAGGEMVAMAECSQPLVSGAILRDDRARIVMPMWLAPRSQCVAPLAAANPLYLTLLGVPESSNFFELSAGRLQTLRHLRQAGGTRVTLDEFGLSALLFLAQDPPIIDAVNQRAAKNGKQTAELEYYLAAQKLETVVRVLGQIGGRMPLATPPVQIRDATRVRVPGQDLDATRAQVPGQKQPRPEEDLDAARQNLALCQARLATGDYAMGSTYARRAMQPLRKLERAAWETAMSGRDSPVTIPGTSSFAALPWYWFFVDRTAAMHPGANRLPGGDFENLAQMERDGWRHFQYFTPGIRTAADLVPEAAHTGRMGLRLTARADDPAHPPAAIEMPPLWITSPAVPVAAGQIVQIHGWIDVPKAITGSVDGLLVVESLAGEEMALRLDKTAGWKEFSLRRIVPQSGLLTLTLSLTGLGEVHLDELRIEVLER